MAQEKVRIVTTEIVTRVCEFTYDEFRAGMKEDDDDLTESSIMKMWLKLIKKKEHKRKDKDNRVDEPFMIEYINEILKK
jgi:hypothetical protein